MPKVRKKCRVCGREYETCHTPKRLTTGFRWQDVACCPECGTEYLRRVMNETSSDTIAPPTGDTKKE